MSKVVFVIAKSGTGKSSSLRNFTAQEASVILCSGKELPFRSELKTMVPKSAADVIRGIQSATTPVVVIDDANYLMSFEEMARANETGYQKFTQMAVNFYNVMKAAIDKQEPNQIFYVLAHAEDRDDNMLRLKTTGKMLSEKIVLEGLTNILLTTDVTSEGEFVFRVRTDGTGVKTPIGMFSEPTVENDLKAVDSVIRSYYGMVPEKKAAEKKPAEPTQPANK